MATRATYLSILFPSFSINPDLTKNSLSTIHRSINGNDIFVGGRKVSNNNPPAFGAKDVAAERQHCQECRSTYAARILSSMTMAGVWSTSSQNFLGVGHTHEDVDGVLSLCKAAIDSSTGI